MSASPYLALLFCFVGFRVHVASQAIPSPTPNPECPGMHRIAKSLETGIKTYTKETTICKVNGACTGLMCNGTHKHNDFYMKMELKHCKTPPEIHLDLIYQPYGIKVHKELKNGRIKISSKKIPGVGSVPIELNLTLKKNRNRITTGLEVEVCPIACQSVATLLPPTTFCLNMKTCPGYNTTGDIPCHIQNPTGNPGTTLTTRASSGPISISTKHSSATSRPRISSPTRHSGVVSTEHASTTLKFSSNKPTRHTVSHSTLPTQVIPTEHSATTLRISTYKPTQRPEPTKLVSTRHITQLSTQNATGTTVQPGDTHAQKRKSGHHHITTGVAVGIAFACVVGVLIIVGAAFYWKKFYRRSRLRAAYYNDISMNDPLYEDFGPEVA